jgi:trimethylguanosine synthase
MKKIYLNCKLKRYWDRLSPEEQNMKIDEETLCCLCPQSVAFKICNKIKSSHIVDAFCGAGGMAIAFALKHRHITAVDINKKHLEDSRYNATLFKVADRIDFIEGNILTTLSKLKNSAVVFDPTQKESTKTDKFTLSDFFPAGERLIYLAKALSFREIIFKVPKNFDFESLNSSRLKWEIQENRFNGKILDYTIYANNI